MSTDSAEVPRSLPDHPNLRHLKDQAKDLVKAGKAQSLTEAQFKIACLYGFASWPKLGYALLFPGADDHSPTRVVSAENQSVSLLRERGAAE